MGERGILHALLFIREASIDNQPKKSGDPECKPTRRYGEKKFALTGHMDDLSEAMNPWRGSLLPLECEALTKRPTRSPSGVK